MAAGAGGKDGDIPTENVQRRSALDCFRQMFEDQLATDVTFRLKSPDGSTSSDVRAHRCVLMSRSEVFHAMFTSGMAETRDDVINVQDIEPETFRLLLRWIYSDEADVTPSNATVVLYAARKYLISGLVDKCIQLLSSGLNVDNACSVLEQSSLLDLPRLQSDCLEYIAGHSQSFIRTDAFFQLSVEMLEKIVRQERLEFSDEGEVYEACVTWARRQLQQSAQLDAPTDQQIRQQLGDVIYRIRFPTMRCSQFAKLFASCDVLTTDEKLAVFFYIGTNCWTDELQFDANKRLFLVCAKSRFQTVTSNKVYLSDGHTTGLVFSVSVNTVLVAIGVYGGFRQGQHEHNIRVTVHDDKTPICTTTARMLSDGSQVPVKVPLVHDVDIKADRKYTVVLSVTGQANTHCGVDGVDEIRLCDNTVCVKFHNSCDSLATYSSAQRGQIPELYLLM